MSDSINTENVAGEWYALNTADREAVFAELELSDPVTVAAWDGLQAACDDWSRVYVTPALNGWTLVFGMPVLPPRNEEFTDEDEPSDHFQGTPEEVVEATLIRLSKRFGKANHFRAVDEYTDPIDFNVWRLAENGTITGTFESTFEEVAAADRWVRLGLVDATELETWLTDDFLVECSALDREPGESARDCARRIAESEEDQDPSTLPMSILWSPLACRSVSRLAAWFGPDAPDEHGVLALTRYGRSAAG